MSEKCSTFIGGMGKMRSYRMQQTCRMFCVVGVLCVVMCGGSSCGWKDAKEVIATAERMDKTEHVVYDDTAAIAGVIRKLDNPLGKLIHKNTLGKAYYFMGRNLEDNYQQVAEAAKCYIEADRLQIDDPIYRGRVNSCMGYICAQNNSDSLALIFYNQASKVFKESDKDWYYAHSILNIASCNIYLHLFTKADSLLQLANTYPLDTAYCARLYEIQGLYFYEQQQYDSALVYFNRGLNYRKQEVDKCFSYLKLTQTYLDLNDFHRALHYAQCIIEYSVNPNYLVNAYYCLLQDAKRKNNTELLSYYSHARTDAQRLLLNNANKSSTALPLLREYATNPHPLRWIKITLYSFIVLCIILVVSTLIYRRFTTSLIQVSTEQINYLSVQIKEQQKELFRQQKKLHYDKCLDKIRRKYPKPLNKWNEYAELKKDIQPYLHNWLMPLEDLDLTNREKVFCAISFIYPQMPTEDLANYLCITKEALQVRKNRIAKKLGITSTEMGIFLQRLANNE